MLLKSRLAKLPAGVEILEAGAFFGELWAPPRGQIEDMIRQRDQDRGGFDAGLEQALAGQDRRRSLAALQALDFSGELTKDTARRLWSALLTLQRWDDALRLLEDPRFARTKHAGYWYDLASAHAAVRPLPVALATAREAAARDPANPDAMALAAALERLTAYEQEPHGPPNWHQLKDHASLLIDLHRFGQAAEVLSASLVRFGASSSTKKLDIGVGLARTLFRVLEPLAALSLFLRLRPAFERRDLTEVYNWACAALTAPEPTDWRPPPDFSHEPFLQVCVGQAFAAHGRWKMASSLFGPIATTPDDPYHCRLDLARCVGMAVVEEIQPTFVAHSGPRKVVDVFRFHDELLLLKLKLEEMSPWVDRFVIIEARTTFTGEPKPLLYEQHKADFAPWADKIVHQVVEFPPWADSPWAREFYQRDMGLRAVSGYCSADDLVLVTDADEIIDRAAIDGFSGEFAALGMDVYNYFFNFRRLYDAQPTYGAAWRAKYLDCIGLSMARIALTPFTKWHIVPNAGWHFTSIKDANGLAAKYRAYSHIEYAGVTREELVGRLGAIRGGSEFGRHQRCEMDERMPKAILNHLDETAEFILQAPSGPASLASAGPDR